MQPEASAKREAIIETATRRFSHFGVDKTTLSEIAEDLNISKPALFYYFSDKKSLIVAVFEKMIEDFQTVFQEKITATTSAEEAIMLLLETRKESMLKNLQLVLQASGIPVRKTSPSLLKLMIKSNKEMVSILSTLFDQAIKKNELRPINTRKAAEIILQTIHSYEYYFRNSNPMPTEKDINQLIKKQKEVIELFFNGLKVADPME